MDKLLAYLNGLAPDRQSEFAGRCGTTVRYLRKACSVGQHLSEGLCLRICAEASSAIALEDLRKDVDWDHLRMALAPANSAQPTIENVAQGVANV